MQSKAKVFPKIILKCNNIIAFLRLCLVMHNFPYKNVVIDSVEKRI